MIMTAYDFLFYALSFLVLVGGLGVVLHGNPIFCSLFLALTMISLSGLFFLLEAYFVAGVQLIVYAGAVIVLFVMVIMIFDLKRDERKFSIGSGSFIIKVVSSFFIFGFLLGSTLLTRMARNLMADFQGDAATTKELAIELFTENIFGFEVISVLLLAVIVGAVALSKIKGGTHA